MSVASFSDVDPLDDQSEGDVGQKIQDLVKGLRNVKNRKEQLDSMIKGMMDNKIFSAEEIDVVKHHIKMYADTYKKMVTVVKEKSNVYNTHIKSLEKTIKERSSYLSDFDHVLVEEPDIAQVIIQRQNNLEEKLQEMYSSIDDTPEEFTNMHKRFAKAEEDVMHSDGEDSD